MRALVIGLGSIGARHVEVLKSLECHVSTVSRRNGHGDFADIASAVTTTEPEYVVIATENSGRESTLAELEQCGYSGRLLIEKPLGHIVATSPPVDEGYVGYNLRFHPVVQRLREELLHEKILSVQARAGQYLPDWRPNRDYRKTASAQDQGGVLRDLSHELDLFGWMFGACRSVTALADRRSSLDLTVDETVVCLARYEQAPIVSAELNYCDRTPQRWMTVTTDRHTFEANLISGELSIDGVHAMTAVVDRDQTYRDMHRDVMSASPQTACTVDEGRNTMLVIDAIENSVTNHCVVSL